MFVPSGFDYPRAVPVDLNELPFRRRWQMLHPLQRAGWMLAISAPLSWAASNGLVLLIGSRGYLSAAVQHGPLLVLVLMSFVLMRAGRQRLFRKLAAHRNLLCLRCKYDLDGLEGTRAVCPECGLAYNTEDVRDAWRVFLRGPL
jgi:hypothetical protein